MPTLLLSVHTLDECVVRLYRSAMEAMQDRAHWSPLTSPSELIGFRLTDFDPEGHPNPSDLFFPV